MREAEASNQLAHAPQPTHLSPLGQSDLTLALLAGEAGCVPVLAVSLHLGVSSVC